MGQQNKSQKTKQVTAKSTEPAQPLLQIPPTGQPLPNVQPVPTVPEIIYNSTKKAVLSRSAYPTGTAWMHSPAMLELLAVASRNLLAVARARGMDVGQVQYVRGARVAGQEEIYIYPTGENDPDRIEVKMPNGNPHINLRSLLAETQRLLPPNHRVRYDINVSGADKAIKDALVLDLNLERDHRITDRSKKSKSAGKKPTAQAKQQPTEQPAQANASSQDTAKPNEA
jgi:hypothetical protein